MLLEIAGNKKPQIADGVFVAASADIIGDVQIEEGASIWFQTVLRGDVMPIKIGKNSNIQDQTCIHGTLNKAAAVIGEGVTVGHRVVLHGCKIGDYSLIGMGSVVMDNAEIGDHCIVAAGSVVTENKKFEPYSLILGSPAKVVRKLTEEEINFLPQSMNNYLKYQTWYTPLEEK